MDQFDDQYGYNPDRAVQLLAEAGYGPGDISIDMSSTVIPGNPEIPQLIEILSTMWEAVGVDTNIIDVEFGAWAETLFNHDIHETFVILRNTPIRTTQEGLRVFWVSAPDGLLYGWESDSINEQYDCLEQSLDVAEREQCARDAGDEMFDDFLTLPLFQTTFDMTIDPEFISGWVYPGVGSAHPDSRSQHKGLPGWHGTVRLSHSSLLPLSHNQAPAVLRLPRTIKKDPPAMEGLFNAPTKIWQERQDSNHDHWLWRPGLEGSWGCLELLGGWLRS